MFASAMRTMVVWKRGSVHAWRLFTFGWLRVTWGKLHALPRTIDHAVVPATGLPSVSVQGNAAPPSCTSTPRCVLYNACIAGALFALKNPTDAGYSLHVRSNGWTFTAVP